METRRADRAMRQPASRNRLKLVARKLSESVAGRRFLMTKEINMQTLNQGNNEQISRGLIETADGYLALTLAQSKTFKGRPAAVRWLAKRGVIVK